MIIFNFSLICLMASSQFLFAESGDVSDKRLLLSKEKIPDKERIILGDLANPGEIKYIIITLHDGEKYLCGGGIIDNYYVLSAAHCFYNQTFRGNSLSVVAGISDINNKEDPRRVEVEVEKIYIPKEYSSDGDANDIALLKLKESLNIEENDLDKLSLPTEQSSNMTNRMALMAGFGNDRHDWVYDPTTNVISEEGTASGFLRKADIKIVSNDEYQELYPTDQIIDSHLCGKMVKKSKQKEYRLCYGDSGSPLVLDSTLIGIVSWSYGCDERKVPMVYTRVSSFLKFIGDAKNDKADGMHVKVFE